MKGFILIDLETLESKLLLQASAEALTSYQESSTTLDRRELSQRVADSLLEVVNDPAYLNQYDSPANEQKQSEQPSVQPEADAIERKSHLEVPDPSSKNTQKENINKETEDFICRYMRQIEARLDREAKEVERLFKHFPEIFSSNKK